MIALTGLEELLKRQMGLDAASIGSSAIESAVRTRQAACKLADIDAYHEYVCESEEELQELIEAIVVPETWFFRDIEAFNALACIAGNEWLPRRSAGVLRLLSLPCSTGEEPYSMAMALIEAAIPAERFRVDAVDISLRALAVARAATYGRNSFRGNDFAFRARHFEATGRGYRVSETVRRQVDFRHGNLFDAEFAAGAYDAVFCRNILIYFDATTQQRAVSVIERALTADGMLFVAPAESGLLLNYDFKVVKTAGAYVFQKGRAARPIAPKAAAFSTVRPAFTAHMVKPPALQKSAEASRPPYAVAKAVRSLDDILRLADQGRLDEAAQCCGDHLQTNGPSAPVFHAMGLISDASDNALEAASYYRKALYLDPNHHEALVHLALTLERLGDGASAQVFRNRARRIENRERTT